MELIKKFWEDDFIFVGTVVFLAGLGFAALGFIEKYKRRKKQTKSV